MGLDRKRDGEAGHRPLAVRLRSEVALLLQLEAARLEERRDALRGATAFAPQVGLLDIGMPGIDGYERAARLRRAVPRPDLFLVAITGWGQEEDRRRALTAGFDAHLTKPADPDAIATLLAARFPALPQGGARPASR